MSAQKLSLSSFKPGAASSAYASRRGGAPSAQALTPKRNVRTSEIGQTPKAAPVAEVRKPRRIIELPPLSTYRKEVETPKKKDEVKRKVLRKIILPQEDLPKIRDIIRNLKGQQVTVQEFVGLIAPLTGDNGQILLEIMANEICTFRTMANQIYNTMTQDISDVLTNEHVQLIEFQKEQNTLYQQRMMRAIDTIRACVTNFNFQAYHDNPDDYLKSLFPLYSFSELDEEQQDLLLRQQAFHRLQWLKTEGDRLGEENMLLQQRLKELKAMANQENERKLQMEENAEIERIELESEQDQLQFQLMDMQSEVQQSLVDNEKVESKLASQPPSGQKGSTSKSKESGRSKFAVKAAREIEAGAQEELLDSSLSVQSVAIVQSKGAIKKKTSGIRKKKKARTAWEDIPVEIVTAPTGPAAPRETSPFHYSPPKLSPQQQAAPRQASPFHYSPLKSPQQQQAAPRQVSPFHYSPPQQQAPTQVSPFHYSPPPARQMAPQPRHYSPPRMDQAAAAPPESPPRRRIERTTTTVEPLPGAMRRKAQAPRDSWGGYY